MADDLTVEILKAIRDETRKTNERLDKTNERLDLLRTEMNENFRLQRDEMTEMIRLQRNEMLERNADIEMRWATLIVGLTGATNDVREQTIGQQELKERVEQCERDISELKKRLS